MVWYYMKHRHNFAFTFWESQHNSTERRYTQTSSPGDKGLHAISNGNIVIVNFATSETIIVKEFTVPI
jgi:hypothetical protein